MVTITERMIHIIITGTMDGITAGIVGTIRAGDLIQASIMIRFLDGETPGL